MKRFELREGEGGCVVVPRTSSVPRRHYDEVEVVTTIPRKDNGSRRAAPPKPPKTYITDDGGASSPSGTPPSMFRAPSSPPLGRVAIANSDAAASPHTDAAINEAYRAVMEISSAFDS